MPECIKEPYRHLYNIILDHILQLREGLQGHVQSERIYNRFLRVNWARRTAWVHNGRKYIYY